jgi:hypothetical protein
MGSDHPQANACVDVTDRYGYGGKLQIWECPGGANERGHELSGSRWQRPTSSLPTTDRSASPAVPDHGLGEHQMNVWVD